MCLYIKLARKPSVYGSNAPVKGGKKASFSGLMGNHIVGEKHKIVCVLLDHQEISTACFYLKSLKRKCPLGFQLSFLLL